MAEKQILLKGEDLIHIFNKVMTISIFCKHSILTELCPIDFLLLRDLPICPCRYGCAVLSFCNGAVRNMVLKGCMYKLKVSCKRNTIFWHVVVPYKHTFSHLGSGQCHLKSSEKFEIVVHSIIHHPVVYDAAMADTYIGCFGQFSE